MSTFYGESYALNYVRVVRGCAGMSERGDAMFYHFDGLSDLFEPADEFTVEAWVAPVELTATDEVVVSWVLELGPATDGTVRLSAGLDPTWSADKKYATQPLGEHTVTGGQTLVAGPVAVTAASLAAWADDVIAHIEVLAGVLEIVQIKLRVWPPQGTGGAWVPAPAATVTDGPTIERQLGYPTNYGFSNVHAPTKAEAEQDAIVKAATDFASTHVGTVKHTAGWGEGSNAIAIGRYNVTLGTFITDVWPAQGSVERYHGFLIADPDLWPMPPRLGIDPNDIAQETTASVRGPAGGKPQGEFAGWDGTLTATYSTSDPPTWPQQPAIFEQHSLPESPFLDPDQYPRSTIFEDYPALADGAKIEPGTPTEGSVQQDVAINAGSPFVALVARAPGVRGDKVTAADPDAGLFGAELRITQSSTGLLYRVAYKQYLWFDPSIPSVAPRFFVKDHDETWRAVGPGKPATDLAIFKVETPTGWYREARHGEDITGTGAHPLKVKVRDGSGPDAWDTVAWMTPQP